MRQVGWHVFGVLLLLLGGGLGCASWSGPSAQEVRLSQATYELALDSFHRGRFREAIAHITRAVELDDANADAAYLGALSYLVFCAADAKAPDCRYGEAERLARTALKLKPELRDARNVLGVILVNRNKPLAAIKVLEPLTRDIVYGSPEQAWGNLGWAYLKANRIDSAIEALKRAVAAQPLFCVGYYRLGLAYEKHGDHAAARHAFTSAVSVPEESCHRLQSAFWGRARVFRKMGMLAQVRQDLVQCQSLDPHNDVGRQCQHTLQGLK